MSTQPTGQPAVSADRIEGVEAVAWQLKCRPEYEWRECTRATFDRGHCGVASHACQVRALYTAAQVRQMVAEDSAIAEAFREVSGCSYAQDGIGRSLFDAVRYKAAAIRARTPNQTADAARSAEAGSAESGGDE